MKMIDRRSIDGPFRRERSPAKLINKVFPKDVCGKIQAVLRAEIVVDTAIINVLRVCGWVKEGDAPYLKARARCTRMVWARLIGRKRGSRRENLLSDRPRVCLQSRKRGCRWNIPVWKGARIQSRARQKLDPIIGKREKRLVLENGSGEDTPKLIANVFRFRQASGVVKEFPGIQRGIPIELVGRTVKLVGA